MTIGRDVFGGDAEAVAGDFDYGFQGRGLGNFDVGFRGQMLIVFAFGIFIRLGCHALASCFEKCGLVV